MKSRKGNPLVILVLIYLLVLANPVALLTGFADGSLRSGAHERSGRIQRNRLNNSLVSEESPMRAKSGVTTESQQSTLVETAQRKLEANTGSATSPQLSKPDRAAQERASDTYGKVPLSFEQNTGQTDPRVKFISRGGGYSLFLRAQDAVMVLRAPVAKGRKEAQHKRTQGSKTFGSVLKVKLAGANKNARIVGMDQLPGKSNYFIGNDPTKWKTDVPNYGKVKYEQVYPGVDMAYYGNQEQLEYDFIVAPGADPKAIKLSFEGVRRLRVDKNGDLVLAIKGGEVRQHKPVVYQQVDGSRREVTSRYVITSKRQVTFEVGGYDASKPLVIDPVLTYSTFLGGNDEERGTAIAVDSSGSAYVTGYTESLNFPTVSAFQPSWAGGRDTFNNPYADSFVAKLNAQGNAFVYTTYLGGNKPDLASGIAVDSSGNAYIAGSTESANFPTANALQSTFGGGTCGSGSCSDAYLTKLNPTGTALVYSTFLGGSNSDGAGDVALDAQGNAYVIGRTTSTNFPTVNPLQQALAGLSDIFVAKVNAAGSALNYSTYLGGSADDFEGGIALDSAGNAYLSGNTVSTNFPTVSPVQATYSGGTCYSSPCPDAIVSKLDAAGSTLLYSTYLGGGGWDNAADIAVDSSGNAYVTGGTASSNFPLANALQPTFDGGTYCSPEPCDDAFITRFNSTGTALVYSTFLGGNRGDNGTGIALDNAGNAYISGTTSSPNFPTVNPLGGTFACCAGDGFVTKFNSTGSAHLYSTYFGGSGWDQVYAMALDAAGSVYITGTTSSDSDLPLASPAQATHGGGFPIPYDAFVAKISDTEGFNISGQIADGGGNVISGVTVTLSGSMSLTVQTDVNGNYSFSNLAQGGNFTVTPSKTNYTFSPSSQNFNPLISNQTANFTGTATSTVIINGRVVDANNAGVSAVTVTLSGTQAATMQTDAGGNYSFANLAAGGSYTVTPSRGSDTFAPVNKSFTNLSSNQTANFTLVYKITGKVTDGAGNGTMGIVLTLTGAQTGSTVTDISGNYSFLNLPANGSYTVTPSKPDYVFTYSFNPQSRTFTGLNVNQIGDFSFTTSTKVGFHPIADAYVQDGTSANTNFGLVTPLFLKTVNTTGQRRDVYLKFDISTLSRSIINAKVRIYAALSASGSVSTSAYSVTDTLWPETGITWNNKPLRNTTAITGSTATITSTNYATYDLDVTSYIVTEKAAGRNVISLALHNPSNSTPHILLNSREAVSNKPQLLITTSGTNNSPPAVNITAPTGGANFTAPASIVINSNASDSDGSISSVAYYAGTVPIGNSSTGPSYQITWPGVGVGNYTLFAVATDNNGATSTSSPISINVNPPNNAPAVFITSPLEGTVFPAGSNVSLSAKATDSDGTLSKVEFFAGSTLVGTATTPGPENIYSVPWNNVATGAYALTAKATDNVTGATTSAAVNISVVMQTGLSPAADAYVRDGSSASTNFGTSLELQTQVSTTAGLNRESYLKFNLATVSGIARAKLRLYGKLSDTSGTNVAVSAYPAGNTNWPESGSGSITWNNKPPSGASLSTVTVTDNIARWYEFDVTSYIKSEKLLGHDLVTIALKGLAASNPYVTFNSKEVTAATDNRPQLVLWTTQTRNALLVVGSSNLNAGDNAAKIRLQNLGFTVTVKVASNSLVTADADGKSVVVVSSTSTAGNVTNKFRYSAVPIVVWEFDVFDDLGMTGTASGDFGTTPQAQTALQIINSTHALAAGLSNQRTVSAPGTIFGWGNPNVNAAKIATIINEANKVAIFGYENGVAMSGLNAPARRVGLFMTDVTAGNFTNTDGGLLFDAAVKWATEVITGPVITAVMPGSGPIGTSVTITGINFGSTQGGSALTFNGLVANPTSWSEKTIVSSVPLLAVTGPVVISVSGVASNGVVFAVGEIDSDGDGLPDNWEIQYFGNLSQTATGDPDGDGINNLQEYQQGRNPTTSALPDAGDAVNLKVHTPLSNPAP